jgi:peptidyl-prolyl cis-trans isomerase C
VLAAALALAACSQPAPVASPIPAPGATATPADTATAAPTATATPEPLAALVNGRPIRLADYEAEVRRCQAAQAFPDCPARALQALIEQAVVEQAAAAAGLAVDEAEVEAEVARIQQGLGGAEAYHAWLAANFYTEATFLTALRRDLLRARMAAQVAASVGETAEQVHALAILVADEATARRLVEQLESGADFTTLALTYSLDLSSRVAGGDLGWFPRGGLTAPEVEDAAFALEPGATSDVIRSALGYHIVRALERDPARPLSPGAQQALRERAFQAWLEGVMAQAAIETRISP